MGFLTTVTGNRNGNLQLAAFYAGAAQPSVLAADIAGALFYGATQGTGAHAQSAGDLLTTGNLDWYQPFENPIGSGATYVVQHGDETHQIEAKATATNDNGLTVTATSTPTDPIAAAGPTLTTP